MFWKTREIYRSAAIDRLATPDDLDEPIRVVRPKDWIPVLLLGVLLALAAVWSVVGRVPVTASGRGALASDRRTAAPLVNVACVPPHTAQSIRPGMAAQVTPHGIERQRFGGIVGTVEAVSAAPDTLEQTTAAIGADRARELHADGPCHQVFIRLTADETTVSGYRWSASRGPETTLAPGIETTTRVTIGERRPAAYLLPFLEEPPSPD